MFNINSFNNKKFLIFNNMISVETEILPYKISNFSCLVNLGLRNFSDFQNFQNSLPMVQISESNPNDMEYHTITLIFLKKKSFNEICLLLDHDSSWRLESCRKLEGNPCNMFTNFLHVSICKLFFFPRTCWKEVASSTRIYYFRNSLK